MSEYPNIKEVEIANQEQLCRWIRFLPSPGMSAIGIKETKDFEAILKAEKVILDRIFERYKESGGFTPEISKKIGLREE